MTAPYTGLQTPCVFDWRISPVGRLSAAKPQANRAKKLNQAQQAASALRTDAERTADNLARVTRMLAMRRSGVQLGPLTESPADIAKTARLLGKPNDRRSQ